MVGKRACSARITRDNTVPSPTPASKTRSAGGAGCRLPSSREIRFATSVFSLQVDTNRRYFCLLSKKRNPAGATLVAATAPLPSFLATDGSLVGVDGALPCSARYARTLSSVPVVILAPSRRRDTSLPSLTTSRPNVDSAVCVARQ